MVEPCGRLGHAWPDGLLRAARGRLPAGRAGAGLGHRRPGSTRPVQAFIVGLGLQIVALPLLVLLVVGLIVSILGIPLLALLPFLLLAFGVIWAAAFAGVAQAIGTAVLRGPTGQAQAIVVLAIGLTTLWLPTLIARAGWWWADGGWWSWSTFGLLGGLGLTIEFIVWSVALGSLVLWWLDRRAPQPMEAMPPPVPESLVRSLRVSSRSARTENAGARWPARRTCTRLSTVRPWQRGGTEPSPNVGGGSAASAPIP